MCCVYHFHIRAFYEQWAQGFPQSQINSVNGALCHALYQAFHSESHLHTITPLQRVKCVLLNMPGKWRQISPAQLWVGVCTLGLAENYAEAT